ncbi:MAG TPA: hypothetical protein VF005_07095 [Acidimicrobiales bacterium]
MALLRQVSVEDDALGAEASVRLIGKIRRFVHEELDEEERVLFGALVAPGIAAAYKNASSEVEGFVLTDWATGSIPADLARGLREEGIRVIGIDQ